MQVEQDYIMKMIHQLIEVLLGDVLRRKDKSTDHILEVEENEKYLELMDLVERYEINQAENRLFENIDANNPEDFKIALQFYQQINQKDDEFLAKANYTREEIRQGILDIAKIYGYENLVKLFLD